MTGLLRGGAETLAAHPSLYIYGSALLLAALEFAERTFAVLQFRKDKVQAILDQMVLELFNSKPKGNCLSLLRARSGFVVVPILIRRALFHQDEKWLSFRAALRNPFGTYLYVWARAKGNRNHRSCAALRVYRSEKKSSEGIAGRVWEKDVYEIHDLPQINAEMLRGLESIGSLPTNSPVAAYARLGNMNDLIHLRARQRYSRHYYGAVIASPKADIKWGVILADSDEATCPWPLRKTGPGPGRMKDFARDFQSFTLTMSILLG